jgi:methionine synthase I (cobalamin-dependent)
MTFREALAGPVLVADGAMGTLGLARGLPRDVAPALWPLDHADAVAALHREYVEAGARVVLTCSFTANRSLHPSGVDVGAANRAAARAARRGSGGRAFVAGDVGPTSYAFVAGSLTLDEAREALAEQCAALVDAGVDLLALETFTSLEELRVAIEAANSVRGDTPLVASMSFGPAAPESLAALADELGVDAVGANCCDGPESTLAAVAALSRSTRLPIWAKPSAGLPADGRYPVDDSAFAVWARHLVDAGARVVGGCCGTTPSTIRTVNSRG